MISSRQNYDAWYQAYRQQGMSEEEARQMASRVSGHNLPSSPEPAAITPTRGFLSGLGQGAREGAGSLIGAAGTLAGGRYTPVGKALQGFGETLEGTGYTEDLTGFGRAGRVVGRVGTELGSAIAGGGLALRGATALPRIGTRVSRALESGSRLQRGAAYAAAGSPIDALQAARVDDGFVLPGRLGAFAENVALSGAAGAILPARRRPEPREPLRLPPGTPPVTPRDVPETRPERLIPRFASGPIRYAPGEVVEKTRRDLPDWRATQRIQRASERGEASRTKQEEAVQRRIDRALGRAKQREERRLKPKGRVRGGRVIQGVPSGRLDPEELARRRQTVEEYEIISDARINRRLAEAAGSPIPEPLPRVLGPGDDPSLSARMTRTLRPRGEREVPPAFKSEYGRIRPSAELLSALGGAGLGALGGFMSAEEGDVQQAGLGGIVGGALGGAVGRKVGPGVARSVARAGRPEVVSSAVGAGLGALSGAGAEDPAAGALTGAAIGAGVGFGAGRLGSSMSRRAEQVEARPRPQPVADVPVTRPVVEPQLSTAAERIQFRPSPYPADFPSRPRSLKELDEFLDRMTNDPRLQTFYEEAREAGRIWRNLGKTNLGDSEAIANQLKSINNLAYRNPSQKMTGPEMLALDKQQDEANELVKQLIKLRDLAERGSPEAARLSEYIRFTNNRLLAIGQRLGRERSQWGLDGRILRETKKNSKDPAVWVSRAESLAGRDLTLEEAGKLIELMARGGDNLVEAQKYMGSLRQSGFWDKAGELYQSGLLTSIMRPVRDLFSSLLNVGDKTVQMTIASGADRMLSGLTGVRTMDVDPSLAASEMLKGMKRGYRAAGAIMRGQGDPEVLARAAERYDFSRETLQSNPYLKSYTTFIRRTIGAPDAVAFETMYAGAMTNYARVAVRNSEAVRSGTVKSGSSAFNDLVTKVLQNPPKEIDEMARAMALEATFQNSTRLGQIGMQLRKSESQAVRFFGKWLVPFIQTPASITTQSVEGILAPYSAMRGAASILSNTEKAQRLFRKSPEAIAKIGEKMDLPAEQVKLVTNAAKSVTAWGWIGLGYALADQDKMTAFFPNNDRERRRWELDGRTEAAVKIGGTWVSLLGMLGPQAQLMAIGAGMRKMIDQGPQDVWNTLWAVGGGAVTGVARAALDSPMLQGINTAVDLTQRLASGDPEQSALAGTAAAQTFVGGWVPQIVQQAARASDVTPEGGVRIREVREPGDVLRTSARAFAQGVPGLRQTLPVRIDAIGRERAPTRGGFTARDGVGVPPIFSPARLGIAEQNPVAVEMWRTKAAIPRTPQRKGEPQEAYEARVRALGEATYTAIERTMNSSMYQNLERMDVDRIKERLIASAMESGMKDREVMALQDLSREEAVARLQGMYLERAVRRARTVAGRRYPDPRGGRQGELTQVLTR